MKKTLLALGVVALIAIPAQAQAIRPAVVQGAVLGGVAGAVIGHNSGRHTGEGAVIGALAGALIGTAVDRSNQTTVVYAPAPQPVYCPPPPVTTQVVYVQSAPVVYSTGYYAPSPAPTVVIYRSAPPPVVVYQNYGYASYPQPVYHQGPRGGYPGRGWRR
ncbi:YMGG-like glycine zipper-containing protein [Rariglobus hedericola]|uniref:Glycine zipper 2TM domain-containing protein n=1 Tax=Rariglobus hedericola TaxID=2597822 RepID=A0A556QJU1_9BACT|nr:YMGG-like glycine zipper-containing protein [Rariglobus hedericola]TSJ76899.1 glycine zipper 2TM domain-containing protein [Rariglobus hedericola]